MIRLEGGDKARLLTVEDFGGSLVLSDDVVGGEVELLLLPDLIVRRHLQHTPTLKAISNGDKVTGNKRNRSNRARGPWKGTEKTHCFNPRWKSAALGGGLGAASEVVASVAAGERFRFRVWAREAD